MDHICMEFVQCCGIGTSL